MFSHESAHMFDQWRVFLAMDMLSIVMSILTKFFSRNIRSHKISTNVLLATIFMLDMNFRSW